MLLKNNAGKDAVWEAQQRGNEELVAWMLGFGEEKIAGQMTEEDAEGGDNNLSDNPNNDKSEERKPKHAEEANMKK